MPEWTHDILRSLAPLALRPEREREIAEELATHLEDRYCDAKGRGASDGDARAIALAELSDVIVPELRAVEASWRAPEPMGNAQPSRWFDAATQNVRYALRSLRLSPGFSAVAVVTLALGIGACTLILSAANSVLLKPLPYRNPDRLVVFWGTAPERGLPEISFTLGVANLYRERARTLESFAVFFTGGFNLTSHGEAERIDRAAVTTDFFRVLGTAPLLGRVPLPSEALRDGPNVVVLSHKLWMRRFAGDSGIVGRTIQVDNQPTTVIGVMPAGFDYPSRVEAWMPLFLDATVFNCWCYDAIGRMRPGVTPHDVAWELGGINGEFGKERPDIFTPGERSRIIAMTLARRVSGSLERPLFVLLAAVGCVLLIACANIANLLLARTAARTRELAVRCCLGASARRIAAQLLTEAMLLALGGAAAGTLLAVAGTRALRQLPAADFPRIDQVRLDPLVLLATIALAVVTAVLCGAAPALRATRVDLQDAIKRGEKGSRARSSRAVSDGFVVVQFALSLMLLVAAGLLAQSYRRLEGVNAGFRADSVLIARLETPWPRYDSANKVRAFYGPLLDRVRALPGVQAVGLASRVPLTSGNPQDDVESEGFVAKPGEPRRVANIRQVTGGYFAAMGTPILRGRTFTASDDDRVPRVAVVDESFARHFWGRQDPLGKRFRHSGDTTARRWVTVIGIVPNVKHGALDEPGDIQVYEHFAQATTWRNFLVVRGRVGLELTPEIRRAVQAGDPSIPVYSAQMMRTLVDRSLGTRRLTNLLLAGFSIVALGLAAIGIFGIVSLDVSGRVRELGIRLALGAQGHDVRALVLRRAMWLALGGVVAGLIGAAATTRYLRTLLFGVGPLDWLTFAAVALVLAITALIASYLPARRATRADPMLALRAE